MKNQVQWLKRHWPVVIWTLAGMAGGYLYYWKVGCVTGTCPISSNPWISTVYGGIMGLLLAGIFSRADKKEKQQNK